MLTNMDKYISNGCAVEKKEKLCRARGGESCAFDGAMIVLQPIADAAHLIHGPISCCGNSWEGRGTLSKVRAGDKFALHEMGFTTDMCEMDIVYGSEEKLYKAVFQIYDAVKPRAIFVHATCVSGLIGEDMEAVCRGAEKRLGIPVIPVNAPGFVGPKNLGNRIAGEVLLDHVIGTGEAPFLTDCDINLIGEYNIAGDLWLVEPVLKKAGFRILSRITGDSTFEEITYAHRAGLNVVVCSRALINIAKEMERRYGIPYVEISLFGKTEMSKAIRKISSKFNVQSSRLKKVEEVIEREEASLEIELKPFEDLRGRKAVLYTGGVKSWSFISALLDLGIEVAAVGTKKSTVEDEEKMKEILGEKALLVEDVAPGNLLKLMREKNADILIAGGRNQYLAVKEGFPFVDVNQERHTAYAGYEGLVNFAGEISKSISFYCGMRIAECGVEQMRNADCVMRNGRDLQKGQMRTEEYAVGRDRYSAIRNPHSAILIGPLKHSQSIGAAIAFQGIDKALPIIHGAQGCTFLAKVLLTKHFREPVSLASTKLFTEDVVMGSEESLTRMVKGFIEKSRPEIVGILTSGLSEVKGDDIQAAVTALREEVASQRKGCSVVYVPTPDYEGGLETGYAKAVTAVIETIAGFHDLTGDGRLEGNHRELPLQSAAINVLAGSHLTPADFMELRGVMESFGFRPILLPDLSALDGSRQGFSALASGGTSIDDIRQMERAAFTIAVGVSMEGPAAIIKNMFGVDYCVFSSLAGLRASEEFLKTLSLLSKRPIPEGYERQRRILVDGMRDAHFYFSGRKICLALETDLSIQMSTVLGEMGADVTLAVIPSQTSNGEKIIADNVHVGDLFSVEGEFDLVISNSHAVNTAKKLGARLYQAGFPVYKSLGNTSKITIGYRGTLNVINEMANLLIQEETV